MPFANQPGQGDLLRHSVVRFHRRGRSPTPPRWVRKSVSSGAPSASPSHLVAFSALNQLPPAPASGTQRETEP